MPLPPATIMSASSILNLFLEVSPKSSSSCGAKLAGVLLEINFDDLPLRFARGTSWKTPADGPSPSADAGAWQIMVAMIFPPNVGRVGGEASFSGVDLSSPVQSAVSPVFKVAARRGESPSECRRTGQHDFRLIFFD